MNNIHKEKAIDSTGYATETKPRWFSTFLIVSFGLTAIMIGIFLFAFLLDNTPSVNRSLLALHPFSRRLSHIVDLLVVFVLTISTVYFIISFPPMHHLLKHIEEVTLRGVTVRFASATVLTDENEKVIAAIVEDKLRQVLREEGMQELLSASSQRTASMESALSALKRRANHKTALLSEHLGKFNPTHVRRFVQMEGSSLSFDASIREGETRILVIAEDCSQGTTKDEAIASARTKFKRALSSMPSCERFRYRLHIVLGFTGTNESSETRLSGDEGRILVFTYPLQTEETAKPTCKCKE